MEGNLGDLLKMLMQQNHKEKLGKKLVNLTPDEKIRWDAIQLKHQDIEKKMKMLKLDMDDIDNQRKRWWMDIENKYKLDDFNLTIRGDQVFELINLNDQKDDEEAEQ